jgi:hypothetical protein
MDQGKEDNQGVIILPPEKFISAATTKTNTLE